MFKKMVSLMYALIVTASMNVAISSYAAVIPPAEPAYVNDIKCNAILTITGTTAKCESSAKGTPGKITRIDIVEQLQEKNSDGDWELNYCWSETAFDCKLTSSPKYRYSLSHGRYRLKTVFTIYSGENYGKYEKITKYTEEKVV